MFQLRRGQGLKTWQTPAMLFNYSHHSKTGTSWAMGQKKIVYSDKLGDVTVHEIIYTDKNKSISEARLHKH